MAEHPPDPPDPPADPPDQQKIDMTHHLTLNSISWFSTPVLYEAAISLIHYPMNINPSMTAPATPVSHGATDPLEYYIPMINSLPHVDEGVTISDSRLFIVIPVKYPVTLCVVITTAT